MAHSLLVNLIDVTLACEEAYSKFVEVVTVADVDAYLIIVTDATDAVSVNFSGRCKFLQI